MQRVPRSRVSREAGYMPSERISTLQTNRLTTRSNLANLCGGASDTHLENSATKHSSRSVDLHSAITVLVVPIGLQVPRQS
ncbi:MAG: hypothetical protein QOK07_1005 [Gemmatimonadaceae bacterium]|jgi:hypothetical protein|nr:hypothetical protein [Gemmatimonadaceae bacterium]